ncbi:hypothetical protein [Streptomyces sennicomposti]
MKLAKPGKAEEPKLMPPFRQLVNGMLPRGDFPELLLEVAEVTGMADAHWERHAPRGRLPDPR